MLSAGGHDAAGCPSPHRYRAAPRYLQVPGRQYGLARRFHSGWTFSGPWWRSGILRQDISLFAHIIDRAGHHESLLGQVITFSVQDLAETAHGLLDRDILAGGAGEHF